MINHAADVTVAALKDWILRNQNDPGCREAAEQLGELGAVSTLLSMLDGPLTVRCALAIASALRFHADGSHFPVLHRILNDYGMVAGAVRLAIDELQDDGECTCGGLNDALNGEVEMDSGVRGVVPPSDHPHLRN